MAFDQDCTTDSLVIKCDPQRLLKSVNVTGYAKWRLVAGPAIGSCHCPKSFLRKIADVTMRSHPQACPCARLRGQEQRVFEDKNIECQSSHAWKHY